MAGSKIIDEITELLKSSSDRLMDRLSDLDNTIFEGVEEQLRSLDTEGDKIKSSVKNLNIIAKIVSRLNKIILTDEYKEDLQEYIKTFDKIIALQNQYFKQLESNFKPTRLLQALRNEAVDDVLKSFRKDLVDIQGAGIREVLRRNITSGGSYKEMMSQLAGGIKGNGQGQYGFSEQIKTRVITSVATFSRSYSNLVAQGLNFEWYQYVGSTITTTRCFCLAMTDRRYFHKTEVPQIIKGNFDEFKERRCKINKKTKLPDGMFKNTNPDNFFTYAGGWNCQHSIFPLPESAVPVSIRNKIISE